MIDDRDDLLREIAAALEIEPRPAFAPGVLARVEVGPARRMWMWPAVVAVGTAAVIAAVMIRPSERAATGDAVQQAAAIGARLTPPPSSAPIERAAVQTPAPTVVATPRVVRPVAAARNARPSRAWEPDVLISPDQAILFRELMLVVADDRVVVQPSSASLLEPITIAELPPPLPIEIPLIHIEPLADSRGA